MKMSFKHLDLYVYMLNKLCMLNELSLGAQIGVIMLIRFNIKNFLSFSTREDGKAQEFSMITGKVRSKKEHIYDDNDIKLLKFAAIYGANASGKSNLVKAIDFMRRTILGGLPKGHTEQFCKVNPENKEKLSYFEIEIMLKGRYYAYGFEVLLNSSKFISEWLVELTPENREKPIYMRDVVNAEFKFGNEFKNKTLLKKLNIYAEDIKDDDSILLLSLMNQNKKNFYMEYKEASILKDVFDWIRYDLDINYPDRPISDYTYMANTENVEEICRIIKAFGTGITDFKMVDVPIEKVVSHLPKKLMEEYLVELEEKSSMLKKQTDEQETKSYGFVMRSNQDFFIIKVNKYDKITCKTIQFSHGEQNVLFSLSEESDGTVRILDLIEILITGNENKTYVIDEMDRCLHPSLSYKFVETYLQLAREKNIQLIVTTHESRLMDFDLLRRDEIWFVDKDISGESNIYSLEEYNARFDQRIDKAYLEGRYGGVPVFSTIFPVKEE